MNVFFSTFIESIQFTHWVPRIHSMNGRKKIFNFPLNEWIPSTQNGLGPLNCLFPTPAYPSSTFHSAFNFVVGIAHTPRTADLNEWRRLEMCCDDSEKMNENERWKNESCLLLDGFSFPLALLFTSPKEVGSSNSWIPTWMEGKKLRR